MSEMDAGTRPTGDDLDSRERTRGAVVVGYDGSEYSRRALEWAIAEARLRDAALVPAVIVPPMTTLDLPDAPSDAAMRAADQLLDDATRLVQDLAPEVRVRPVKLVDAPARGLIQLAEGAQLLVVGSRGRGGVASMMLGSVSLRVAQRAACPTVVIPAKAKPATERRIVVGVDGSAQSEAALSFAMSEAALHDAHVVAVHSIADPYLGGGFLPPAPELVRAREEAGMRFLRDDLEPWRSKHPDIPVIDVLTHEPAGTALPERAAGSDMIVVGARGRGAFAGMFLGSVSHATLHAASVPVAIVRGEQNTH